MFVKPYDIGQFPAAGPRVALKRGVGLFQAGYVYCSQRT